MVSHLPPLTSCLQNRSFIPDKTDSSSPTVLTRVLRKFTNVEAALAVTGIVVNAVSVALSALTSLDWSSEMVRDKEFLDRLLGFVHVHGDGKISLVDVPKDADMRT